MPICMPAANGNGTRPRPAGVILAAGLHASRLDGSPMRYNQLDPYLPDFVMCRAEVAPVLFDAIRQAWY